MKKFSVYGTVIGGKHMGEYEAKTKTEAIEMAIEKEGFVSLCHQCSNECEDPNIENVVAEEIEQ